MIFYFYDCYGVNGINSENRIKSIIKTRKLILNEQVLVVKYAF